MYIFRILSNFSVTVISESFCTFGIDLNNPHLSMSLIINFHFHTLDIDLVWLIAMATAVCIHSRDTIVHVVFM